MLLSASVSVDEIAWMPRAIKVILVRAKQMTIYSGLKLSMKRA